MRAYLFSKTETASDAADIRLNGMWFQEGQSGYDDILKRGYSQPKSKFTILAELHSRNTPDFLHSPGHDVHVPFLVSARTKSLIRKHRFTGIRFSAIEIVKIATKGERRANQKNGEPEDVILKAKDQSRAVVAPRLYAARVDGRLEILPDYPSGRSPGNTCISPFNLPTRCRMPDLWRPTLRGRALPVWVYCSPRFRELCIQNGLSNISFQPFEERMSKFREGVEFFQELRRRQKK